VKINGKLRSTMCTPEKNTAHNIQNRVENVIMYLQVGGGAPQPENQLLSEVENLEFLNETRMPSKTQTSAFLSE